LSRQFDFDEKKQRLKIIISSLVAILLVGSAIEGALTIKPAFSLTSQVPSIDSPAMRKLAQSVLQSSTEAPTNIDTGTVEVAGGPIEIIPNSFIVVLKTPEAGALDAETVGAFTAQLESAGGNVSAVYDQLGMFNIQFESPQVGAASLAQQAEAEQFVETLKANPAVEAVFNDAIVSIQQQVLPNDQNRVDADLSPTKSGDGTESVDADIAILDTGVQSDHPDLNVFKCVSVLTNRGMVRTSLELRRHLTII
jgi:hypothetical protein